MTDKYNVGDENGAARRAVANYSGRGLGSVFQGWILCIRGGWALVYKGFLRHR